MTSPETWWGSAFCLYGCITVLFLLAFNELAWISATPHEPTDAEAEQSLQDWTFWKHGVSPMGIDFGETHVKHMWNTCSNIMTHYGINRCLYWFCETWPRSKGHKFRVMDGISWSYELETYHTIRFPGWSFGMSSTLSQVPALRVWCL